MGNARSGNFSRNGEHLPRSSGPTLHVRPGVNRILERLVALSRLFCAKLLTKFANTPNIAITPNRHSKSRPAGRSTRLSYMGTALISVVQVALVSIALFFLFCSSTFRRWFRVAFHSSISSSAASSKSRRTLPPGPTCWPILGSLLHFREGLKPTLAEFSRKYGGIVYFKLGSKPVVLVTSSSLARVVLREQDSLFCNRPPASTVIKQLTYLEDQIPFADYGPHYRFHRYVVKEGQQSDRETLLILAVSSEVPCAQILVNAAMNSHLIGWLYAQEDDDAGAVEPAKGDSVQAPQRIRARCAC